MQALTTRLSFLPSPGSSLPWHRSGSGTTAKGPMTSIWFQDQLELKRLEENKLEVGRDWEEEEGAAEGKGGKTLQLKLRGTRRGLRWRKERLTQPMRPRWSPSDSGLYLLHQPAQVQMLSLWVMMLRHSWPQRPASTAVSLTEPAGNP